MNFKKILGEIFVAFIPNKMSRNRWRGLFRYGLIRVIKLWNKVKNDNSKPDYYLTCCAIAKNEGEYFIEWIEYHKNLGVEKFYIYDNESSDNTKEILAPYIKSGIVDYTYLAGLKQQLPAYNHCIEKHRLEAYWIAFIDLDEFIVPQKDKNIPDFLKRFESFAAIEINWLIYGSGGAKKREIGSVMERFKCHSVPTNVLNRHVKNIVNPRRIVSMVGSHEAVKLSGCTVDSHGKPIKKFFRNRQPQHDVIRINHYATKSYEEFSEKNARGRVASFKKRDASYFNTFDLNDIKE